MDVGSVAVSQAALCIDSGGVLTLLKRCCDPESAAPTADDRWISTITATDACLCCQPCSALAGGSYGRRQPAAASASGASRRCAGCRPPAATRRRVGWSTESRLHRPSRSNRRRPAEVPFLSRQNFGHST